MAYNQKYVYILISLYLYSITDVLSADEECDTSKCKGPIRYYEDLQCTAIYVSEDTCCPARYICDNLQERSDDKCYYMDHVYEIGEYVGEDAPPCNGGCYCIRESNDVDAEFSCPMISCVGPSPGCYMKKSHDRCCGGPEVCPNVDTEIAQCEVDGKTYLDGQEFTPSSDRSLSCICGPGYTGENVSPFCERRSCNVMYGQKAYIRDNCAPVFYNEQNPATDCNVYYRCQNDGDVVLQITNGSDSETEDLISDPSTTCYFGQLTMRIGDELNSGTDRGSSCVRCVCEIPPWPTCQQIPMSQCFIS